MKILPLLLISGLGLLLQPPARAQEAAPAFKEEAMTITRQLAAFISLDDARQLPVRRLTQQRLSEQADARQLYANDPDMLQQKLTAIGQAYTTQLGTILAPAQYERYLAAAPGTLHAAVAAVRTPAPVVITQVVAATTVPRKPAPKPVPARPAVAGRAAAKGAAVRR
ncbi:hypothetical protein [Hymenobacter rubripertinctus]|uniref:Uncharacterized protein n=1 Tax=Hymenobacter rubripertinctus TaxID=2029981 RepID=A0A418QJL7_9BACT|nr:hypothetical protein [Hymenobacter rubripertinctus]RIY05344.1 hypothetical protein D0T11_20580 [Hymenobacter rubripertinctus]